MLFQSVSVLMEIPFTKKKNTFNYTIKNTDRTLLKNRASAHSWSVNKNKIVP